MEKLIKCKYQDNFEMIQVFRKLVERHGVPGGYNAAGRRNSGVGVGASGGNKENVMKKSGSTVGFPMTAKASQAKSISFWSGTPSGVATTTMKAARGVKGKPKEEVKISDFLPNREKSDEEKLRLIREILQSGGEHQLESIRGVVFEEEDSLVDSEEELDVL